MTDYTATYSPDDNKLRLYSVLRLPKDIYDRAKALGFRWAPKQDLFVAPAWTPGREDFLLELAGEIEDEDKSLVDRQEERADRFDDYRDKRREEADRAHDAVERICDGIPMGQPILVGHHSERRARRDAEKIENGMRKAIGLWETSEYWKRRASAARSHARYKERIDVRARRIKAIEADRRRNERTLKDAQFRLRFWRGELKKKASAGGGFLQVDLKSAIWFTNHFDHLSHCFLGAEYPRPEGMRVYEGPMGLWSALGGSGDPDEPGFITPEQAKAIAIPHHERIVENAERWIAHCDNRLAYEREMLEEQGGLVAQRYDIQPGGMVLVRGEWVTVLRVNRSGGAISSVRTNRRYVSKINYEEIQGYREPTPERAAAVQKATEKLPLCNYPGEGFRHVTQAEWKNTHSDYKGTTEIDGTHRVRYLYRAMNSKPVFLVDAKRKDPPAGAKASTASEPLPLERVVPQPVYRDASETPEAAPFKAMEKTLKAGIRTIEVNQLFATPKELAARMADIIGPCSGKRILEPEAGTAALLRAVWNNSAGPDCCRVVAVEANPTLCAQLEEDRNLRLGANEHNFKIVCADFLQCNGDLGLFDAVIMNPPFGNAEDVKHILHARTFLKPTGILTALCANGSRQNQTLKPLTASWEVLPAGTFSEKGTNVNVALLTIRGS